LLPRIPCQPCFMPAALVGFTLRRFPPPRGRQNFSALTEPTCRSIRSVTPPSKRQIGPIGLGFWVHSSRGCLAATRRFRPTATGASLGVCPFRAFHEDLGPDFSGPPLTCFTCPGDCSPGRLAPQSLYRSSLRLARQTPKRRPAEATLVGFVHLPTPDHSSFTVPGLMN